MVIMIPIGNLQTQVRRREFSDTVYKIWHNNSNLQQCLVITCVVSVVIVVSISIMAVILIVSYPR